MASSAARVMNAPHPAPRGGRRRGPGRLAGGGPHRPSSLPDGCEWVPVPHGSPRPRDVNTPPRWQHSPGGGRSREMEEGVICAAGAGRPVMCRPPPRRWRTPITLITPITRIEAPGLLRQGRRLPAPPLPAACPQRCFSPPPVHMQAPGQGPRKHPMEGPSPRPRKLEGLAPRSRHASDCSAHQPPFHSTRAAAVPERRLPAPHRTAPRCAAAGAGASAAAVTAGVRAGAWPKRHRAAPPELPPPPWRCPAPQHRTCR